MNQPAREVKSLTDAALHEPTSYGIMKDITHYFSEGYAFDRFTHNNASYFKFPYSIAGSWFDKSDHIGSNYRRPTQFSNPLGLILSAQCTLSNAMKFPGRICGTLPIGHSRTREALFEGAGEPQPYFTEDPFRKRLVNVVEELQVLAAFRKRSNNQEIYLTEREVAALFRMMIPALPHIHRQKAGYFLAQYHYRDGSFKAKPHEVMEKNACYMPEVLARMLKSDGVLDYSNSYDDKLIKDIDGILCNIGNALVLRDADVDIKWKTAAELGTVITQHIVDLEYGIRSENKNKFYSLVANAFGQLAIDAGIDRPNFTLKGFQEYLETKVGIVHLMRTIGSMKGKMEGFPRFAKFELARADFEEAKKLIEDFKLLPADKLGAEGEKLRAFLNDPDLATFMDAYKARFPLAKDATNSVVNTNPQLDHLLCRAPESGRFADYMSKQTVGRT